MSVSALASSESCCYMSNNLEQIDGWTNSGTRITFLSVYICIAKILSKVS